MLSVSKNGMSLQDFYKVVFQLEKLAIDAQCLEKIKASHKFLLDYSNDKIIYGVNTGFGPMAQHIIPKEDLNQLQYNLIRSHASCSGNVLDEISCRAVVLGRLISLSRGYSGIHENTVELLVKLLNEQVSPLIYEHGGVGASGDLTQLAHLALGMIGEGEVYSNSKTRNTSDVFKEKNISPLQVHLREGLSLINGTSAMTGIGLINVINAKKLFYWHLMLCAFLNEITFAYDDHHSTSLNEAKKHQEQIEIAQTLRTILSDSKRTKNRYTNLESESSAEPILKEKLQEFYSIRCVPQILGPIKRAIDNCEKVLLDELNSANDNPIIDHEKKEIFHGGNFHGDYVSFEMDKLKIAITKLTMLCERQINFLMNHKINDKLSPFINMATLGLNFGLQGMQFTATSTTAENQTLSFPMYVHSISTNNDNQDIVSMGTNSALMTKKVIENCFEVLGIGLMSALQAVDYLNIEKELSSKTQNYYKEFRGIVETIIEDKPRYKEMKNLVEHLKSKDVNETIF